MQQSTRLQREEFAPPRPLLPCCDAEEFVQPVILGETCPVVTCDRALIEAPGALGLDALEDAPSAPEQEPGAALAHEAWEPAEVSCAPDAWESGEPPSPCTDDEGWQAAEPDTDASSPQCCSEAGCASGPQLRDLPWAPLRPEVLKGYFPLVRKLVRQVSRHLPPNVQRDDLLSAGMLGLVDSLRKNGGSDGETFAGYAKLRIRGAIVDELRAQDWLSRRAREAVEAGTAAKVGGATVFVSLSEVTPAEESVHMAGGDDPIEAISAQATRRALSFAIAQLPERERRVIGMYYFEGAKLKDIGAELGVGEPRVSQLHTRALGMLRGMLSHA
ncbi:MULTISPECIES: sigma-70 family RNA polymerase sigma factor [Sorangium]|uniref:RNA polymerase sigma factor n=1 Tax=Sorangium cellulosum TaxID=56 RepID=A0A4P2QZ57_SORCE|nr:MULTISPECIES: sigma-70 family RNA polymerase sigma factor [Sorangium]AUX35596.1 RNA polymerase sigma factor [Sorangium cellulosum]WCQ94896.1 RNA polymerase sigma factor [Sorangium sp. Soce836]